MKLTEAQELIEKELTRHGLDERGWTFDWDKALRRFGCTKYRIKTITLSKELTKLNSRAVVYDTILHEVAHALAGQENHHNRVWRQTAWSIGCSGQRTYNSHTTLTPKVKWIGTCPNGHTTERFRRMKLSCSRCCPTWNPNYMFEWNRAV